MSAETDPKKIAERLEQIRRDRLKSQPRTYEQAVQQIRDHSRGTPISLARPVLKPETRLGDR